MTKYVKNNHHHNRGNWEGVEYIETVICDNQPKNIIFSTSFPCHIKIPMVTWRRKFWVKEMMINNGKHKNIQELNL